MSHMEEKIDNLSKVTLALQVGTLPDATDLTPDPVPFEFIYGIGSKGLTPFEFALANRSEGETVAIPIRRDEVHGYFGFNRPPILPLISGEQDFYITARVLQVTRAEGREVVKAMAAMAACSDCGGDCCGHSH